MDAPRLDWAKSWLSQEKRHYIGREWVAGSGAEWPVYNPSTEQQLSTFRQASANEVDRAVAAARSAFLGQHWLKKSMRERVRLLQRIAAVIRSHKEELATLETLNNGKTYRESLLDDLPDCAYVFDYYAGWIDKHYGEVCPVNPGLLNYTLKEPLGMCAQIVPWNFPLLMATWKIAPALAMGNTVVIKPSEYTPLSLIYLCEIIEKEVDLPKGVLNCVLGDGKVGDMLSIHPDVHKVAFTGSTVVGKKIVQNAGLSNLKQVSLELGGKSPCIFFDDINNLEEVAVHCYEAMFCHKGEKCSEPTRFIIHERIFDQLADLLIKKAKLARLGDPFADSTEQGPQCHKKHFESVLNYIEKGKSEGATLLVGGHIDQQQSRGYFIRPTIFAIENPSLTIAQEEIFGPVLVLEKFSSEEEAVELANHTKYGLAAGLYTNNVARAHRVASKIDAGMVFVNRYGCYEFSSPFGGFKQSGWGKEMAIHSLASYTKTKSIWLSIS